MKKITAQEIIKGCSRQNPTFQKALVVQYSSLLMGVAVRYTRDHSSAKDILQESLIKILKGLPNYKEQGNFEAWMKRIVINTALKSMDKASFKNELYALHEVPENTVAPSIFDELAAEEILEIIDQLPDTYKTVFNLHVIEGYSHQEIGELLGIAASSSRSQLTRARVLLKKNIAKNDKIRLRI